MNVPVELGGPVAATDGSCGTVLRLILQPEKRILTHLAIGPRHGAGHLVPVGLLAPTDTALSLGCAVADFDALPSDQDAELVADGSEPDMSSQTDSVSFSYFASQIPGPIGHEATLGMDTSPRATTFDRVPTGEEQIRPEENVTASDGRVGHVAGVRVDIPGGAITHLLIDTGHRWNRRHRAIPVDAIAHFGISLQLTLTKQQIGEF